MSLGSGFSARKNSINERLRYMDGDGNGTCNRQLDWGGGGVLEATELLGRKIRKRLCSVEELERGFESIYRSMRQGSGRIRGAPTVEHPEAKISRGSKNGERGKPETGLKKRQTTQTKNRKP